MIEQPNSEACDDDKGEAAGVPKGKGKARWIEIRRIVENGKRRWEMQDEVNGTKPGLDFEKKSDQLYKSDWHDLTFRIKDSTNDLRFHCLPTMALWVARGTMQDAPKCPDKPSHDSEGEFVARSVSPDGKVLTVYNGNYVECKLAFALNFVDKNDKDNPGAKIVDCFDPIITNRNSGINRL